MYTLLKAARRDARITEQLPAFVISLVLAETLYKFKSFTLECLAFLLTWFVLDYLSAKLFERFRHGSNLD
ncbi:MAG: hypothetical protein AB7F78_20715 [Hyphomicrobiaceae bacterium]